MFRTMTFHGLRSTVAAMAEGLDVKASTKIQSSRIESSTARLVLAALLCVVLSLDISQLAFALVGAVIFAILQSYRTPRKHPQCAYQKNCQVAQTARGRYMQHQKQQRPCQSSAKAGSVPEKMRLEKSKPSINQMSSGPIAPPTFQNAGWDAECDELLEQISPTTEGEESVKQLAQLVQRMIRPVLPEVEVVGFASGNFARGKAFGVAVPEVDIIASLSPIALARCLRQRAGEGKACTDPLKLQKWAIRACTDRLVATGHFKFRRSAFRGQEPKVTLLASESTGICNQAIPIDFAVNAVTPLYSAALLTECGQMESRAKALILLVRRWAKDRGICHAPKGHLTPYAWSLLAIYYLQVGACTEGSLLPPLKDFAASSGLMSKGQVSKSAATCNGRATASNQTNQKMSIGFMFKEFVHFYHSQFDWRGEAVSVRAGARAAPDLGLPLHIVVQEDGHSSEVGPSVEDPFEASRNLGGQMTAESLRRLHEELSRAEALCAKDASLTELLEPWCPPGFEARDPGCKEDEEDDASTRVPSESAHSSPPRSPPPTPPKVSPRTTLENAMSKSSAGCASVPPWRRR
mmetsp:Transcript_84102/g.153588  ORF Transcript_84102/g.153588 Transcript_84102/m.153588 type:complete len:578 (+) Transcript_84102:108-1841(+)